MPLGLQTLTGLRRAGLAAHPGPNPPATKPTWHGPGSACRRIAFRSRQSYPQRVHPTSAAIHEALTQHDPRFIPALPGRQNHRPAAVLVPLVEGSSLRCIATLRSAHLKHHAGEICFPGGRPEATDANPEETALREAREELGIRKAAVLGTLSSIPLFTSDFRIQPYVAVIEHQTFCLSDEVAAVLDLSIDELLANGAVDALHWSLKDQHGLSPIFRLKEGVMFGATAHALYELLSVLAPLYDLPTPPLRACGMRWSDLLPKGFDDQQKAP